MSNKRKSNTKDESSDSSLSDLEEPVVAKKPNKSSGSTKSSHVTTSGGDQLIDLTGKKFACVREFRGKAFVDIREYYEDKSSGELKPGKKGKRTHPTNYRNTMYVRLNTYKKLN
ncbi:unnamed protein product [Schistosoma bovis]|nr:unnamed protein product [Schistosoma bovis]